MTTQTEFRCYYEDGTVTTGDVCPLTNGNGSPLIKSELQIIEDAIGHYSYPWLLLILGLVALFADRKK